jgi:hypothetical protein
VAWLAGLALGPLFAGVAALTSPVMGLVAAAGLVVGTLILIEPMVGFFLTVLVIPLERIGRFTNDSSMVTFSLIRVTGMVTLGALLVHALIRRHRLGVNLPFVLYALYLGIGVTTLSYTTDFHSGVRSAGAMLGNLVFLFLVINMVDEWPQVVRAAALWLAVSVGVGCLTIYQWHGAAGRVSEDAFASTGERSTQDRFSTVLEDAAEFETSRKMVRAMGPTSHPAVYAINNILTLPFLAYFWATAASRKARLALAAAGAVIGYNVLLTNTRAALLALVAVGAMLLWTRMVRIRAGWAFVGVLAGACAIPFLPSALFERILDPSNWSLEKSLTLQARLRYWEAGLEAITENPIAGIGLGNQTEIPRRMRRHMLMPDNSTAHNEYIQSTMEVGVVGAAVLFSFLVVMYRRIRAAEAAYALVEEWEASMFLTAARIALVATLVYAVQVDVLHFPLKGWWLAMGLAMVLHQFAPLGARQRGREPAAPRPAWSSA